MSTKLSRHRNNKRRASAAALCCATALFFAVSLSAGDAAGQPLRTGISDPDANALGNQLTFDRIHDAGARFVRLTVIWPAVAPDTEPALWTPTDPGDLNYNWTVPDREVRMAVTAGLIPIVQIYGAPRWAERCDIPSDRGAPCNPDPKVFASFAKAAARRYSGAFSDLPRIHYWMLLNEPNLFLFFNPQFNRGRPVSPGLYRRLLNHVTPAIHSIREDNFVLVGGLAPLERPGASVGPLDFVRRMLCMKGRRDPRPTRRDCSARFDILATNPYTTGGPTHEAYGTDDVSLGDLPELQELLRAASKAGRIETRLNRVPLWVTEFSWDSKPPDPGGLGQRLHARWAAEALYRAWLAGVNTFLWFQLRDSPRGGAPFDESVQSGLYLRGETLEQDRPKPALRAFRFPFVAIDRFRSFVVWGRTPDSGGGRVVLEAATSSGWRKFGTVRANANGIFHKLFRGGYGIRGDGLIRAKIRGRTSVPFSLRYVPDFYHPPFG